MALRDSMRSSATQFLKPGEQIPAVIGAQTARIVVTRLGPGTGMWHKIPVGDETLRVCIVASTRTSKPPTA